MQIQAVDSKRRKRTALAAILALLLPVAAIAAEPVADPKPALTSSYVVTIGSSLSLGPTFEGAGSAELHGRPSHLSGLPSLNWRKADEAAEFSAPDDSLDFTLYSTGQFRMGPVANVRGGRYRGDDMRLQGLKNKPWTLEAGAFAEYWPLQDRLRTRIEIRRGIIHGHEGFISDLSSDLVFRISKFTLSGGPRLAIGDHSFMNTNFGVTPLEAQRNTKVSAFTAGAGVKSTGLASALSYEWSDRVTTTIFHRYDRLMQDAAKSPITRNIGQRNQYMIGASLNYSFKLDM